MDIRNENALTVRLFSARAACPKCRNRIDYRSGADLARESGIHDNVVICPRCRHVYTCVLIPGSLTLQDDVTEGYPGVSAEAARREQAAAEADDRGGKKRGFFAGLFRKKGGAGR